MTRDLRTSSVVEALVLEGVLGTGRAAQAADVIDRVLTDGTPEVFRTRPRSSLVEWLRYAGLTIALVAGQLAVLDEFTDALGYAMLALAGIGAFLAYVVRPAAPYLLLAVAATTLVIPQLVADLSDGVLGVEGAWLMTGMALFCSGLVAWRLREERSRQAPSVTAVTSRP